jgi:hypothetical protein
LNNFFSREKAVELPHDMAVMGYLLNVHRVPRITAGEGGLVYHYTNSDGLLGILKTNRFWATDAAFLNDPTEGSHALDLARDFLSKRIASSAVEQKLIEGTIEGLRKSTTDLFVVSFCRDGDLLSQWLGYGSFGAGYALGFDLARLAPPGQVGWLIEVIYDDDHLQSVVSDVFNIYVESLHKENGLHLDDLIEWCPQALRFMAQGYKHPSYRAEKEIRLLFRRSSHADGREKHRMSYEVPISYRARGPDVLPFLDVPLDFADRLDPDARLPLREIIAGPGVPYERNARALSGLLASVGQEGVKVAQSSVPFRP